MKKIYAIVAKEIRETGTVSFKFMFDSKAPYRVFSSLANRFGILTLKKKPDDFFDPFTLGLKQQEADLSDMNETMLRWSLFVFESGRGQVLGGGIDQDKERESLVKLIGEAENFVLLTHIEALESLKFACEKLNIDLSVFTFDGVLSSS